MSVVDRIDCPKCSQPRGSRCRALTTGRTTDTHQARYDAYWEERDAAVTRTRPFLVPETMWVSADLIHSKQQRTSDKPEESA
jgi:hypothetical protein